MSDYREVVRIREDGTVEVTENDETVVHEAARAPTRPNGIPPKLTVDVSVPQGKTPVEVHACATVTEGSAGVYYTRGADENGIYNNERVLWELFGPEEEDYRFLNREQSKIRIHRTGSEAEVEVHFRLKHPGSYRLRAATVDMAGRTAVVWKTITIPGQVSVAASVYLNRGRRGLAAYAPKYDQHAKPQRNTDSRTPIASVLLKRTVPYCSVLNRF